MTTTTMTTETASQLITQALEAKTVVSMEQAKASPTKGTVFVGPKGNYGVCTGETSEHKKPLAFMTCLNQGCQTLHLRERSDWHQSGSCTEHKPKSKKSSSKKPSVSKLLKADPSTIEDPDIRAKVEELQKASKDKILAELQEKKEKLLASLQEKIAKVSAQ